ncbi:MAG: S8 family peptidase [Bacteroidota bacterium]
MTDKNASKPSQSKYRVDTSEHKLSAMDPQLEAIASAEKQGQPVDPAFVHETTDGRRVIEVIAKLKDPSVSVPGLTVVTSVRQIITGTVDVKELDTVAGHDNVMKLEAGRKVFLDLEDSVREIRARRVDLEPIAPQNTDAPDGTGVIIGIVDYGCDYLHRNFRNADGSTRILSFWHQDGSPDPQTPSPQPYGYGREISASIIDRALAQETAPPDENNNPFHPEDLENGAYQYLSYYPSRPPGFPYYGQGPAHGTHVMDIAAGNGRGSGFPGVAPGADIIFVQLSNIVDTDEATESFGSSSRLIQAVQYIFDKAAELNRSAVVNLSLGTHGGPHDGTTSAEQYFDGLLDGPNRAIVISAGNSYFRRIHASGEVSSSAPRDLTWEIRNTTQRFHDNELEIWCSGNDELDVTLVDPDGDVVGTFSPSPNRQTITMNGREMGVANYKRDVNNGDLHLDIYFYPKPQFLPVNEALPTGNWQVQIRSSSRSPILFHAWIERTAPSLQSRFAEVDSDPSHTIGSISCGYKTISVGSYNARGLSRPLSSFTAEGPTRDGRQKPEISAPGGEVGGDGVLAARSNTHTRRTQMPGTSMAAPHVTGLVALLMQVADGDLAIDDIRNSIIDTARRNSSVNNGWHPRYGAGRIDAAAAVSEMVPDAFPTPQPTPMSHVTTTVQASNGKTDGISSDFVAQLTKIASKTRTRMKVQIEIEPSEEMPAETTQHLRR